MEHDTKYEITLLDLLIRDPVILPEEHVYSLKKMISKFRLTYSKAKVLLKVRASPVHRAGTTLN